MKFSSAITLSALLVASTSGFTMPAAAPRTSALASTMPETDGLYFVDEAPSNGEIPSDLLVSDQLQQQTVEKPKPKKKMSKKPNGGHKQDGLFSPVVQVAKKVLGEDKLNKVRGKAIGVHSDVIRGFVESSDSEFGQIALKTLFSMADADKNGRIDEVELRKALKFLRFTHLKEKQISGIFGRADKDGDGTLDFEEFKAEAPKTLKTNLIKLAKSNGGELGFLA